MKTKEEEEVTWCEFCNYEGFQTLHQIQSLRIVDISGIYNELHMNVCDLCYTTVRYSHFWSGNESSAIIAHMNLLENRRLLERLIG